MALVASPRSEAGRLAVAIFGSVLEEVRADRLVRSFARLEGDVFSVQDETYRLSDYQRVVMAAVGKASVEMASAALEVLDRRVDTGLVVTKKGYGRPVDGFRVIEAGHPGPDEDSLLAGEAMLRLAESCGPSDFVLFLLSGGASSLMELPVEGLALADIQASTEVLHQNGVDITTMNAVRSHISRLKAGGLGRAFGDATVVCLVLSDVVGNALATVGSGPLIAPSSDVVIPDALLDKLPANVRQEVLAGGLMGRTTPRIPHVVIGSLSVAIHAAADAAREMGLDPLPFGDPMRGEAREMSRRIMSLAERHVNARPKDRFCMVFGGETTVTIRGKGKGGRAQEMALAAAPRVAKYSDLAFLCCGTDGTDGPTDAAGGLVESDSVDRARAAGFDARRSLVANDSYHFLEASEGLIVTGPTGSNVNDICLVVHAPISN